MIKVSVLMAAYNARQYVAKSIESMRAQTMPDWQLICVDDASQDDTLEVLRRFSADDPRIQVVGLERNSGIATARNRALQLAEGEYICMLDSDDWFSPDALAKACDVLDQEPDTDTVLFQVDEVRGEETHRFVMPQFDVIPGNQAFVESLTWKIHGLYMVRANLHKQFPYDESSKHYSDENITRIHYLCSRNVRQCGGIYYYRQHVSSVTHQVSIRRFDFLRANESMRQMMMEMDVPEDLLAFYEKVRWLNLIDMYFFYYQRKADFSSDERRYGLSEIRKAWKSIHTQCVSWKLQLKFGYMPLKPFWPLFRLQEEAYFSLRRILRRNHPQYSP